MPLWGGSVTLPGPAESSSEDAAGWAPSRSVSDDFAKRFPELYRRAYVVAYRIVGNQNTAQDVAQEALARAYLASNAAVYDLDDDQWLLWQRFAKAAAWHDYERSVPDGAQRLQRALAVP